MYYAQLIKRKGADLLLKAYQNLKAEYKDIELFLIGSGIYKKELLKIINKENLSDVLLLEDPGDDLVCKYYANSDIFVLPSREDVWGLVVNEAMSCSLPVIVSDAAGASGDLVKDGYNGFIFKAGDVEDLTSKLQKLIISSKLRGDMGNNSKKLIANFDPKVTVSMFNQAIKYALKK